MEDVPHRRLTKPRKVFEYFFEGQRPGRGRENIVKLEVRVEAIYICHSVLVCR